MGSFLLQCNDHLPLVPGVGNRLFAGSSSDMVMTVGGVDREGNSAVCDMTYIVLKAAEMLTLRDPNLNARYHPKANSLEYLRRLCEVNLITTATPSIHNDEAVIATLVNQGFALEDARDWGATGCVEPTSCGRHFGHTNCMLLNMVAPLEMALNDGYHPLLREQVGPQTGESPTPPLRHLRKFLAAYKEQLGYLIGQSVECNNLLRRGPPVPAADAAALGADPGVPGERPRRHRRRREIQQLRRRHGRPGRRGRQPAGDQATGVRRESGGFPHAAAGAPR